MTEPFSAAAFARRGGNGKIYYVALAATWIPLGALVLGAANRSGTAGFGTLRWSDYALTQVYAVPHYLRLSPLACAPGLRLRQGCDPVARSADLPAPSSCSWLLGRHRREPGQPDPGQAEGGFSGSLVLRHPRAHLPRPGGHPDDRGAPDAVPAAGGRGHRAGPRPRDPASAGRDCRLRVRGSGRGWGRRPHDAQPDLSERSGPLERYRRQAARQ